MLEAKIEQGALLKKLVESIKDVVADINWDCNETGISLQAIDNAHVALVALLLRAEGFDPYRCDRNMTLGIKSESLSKILKCAGNDDKITIRAMDDSDSVTFVFEGKNERLSEYQLKLMDIDTDHLGIPDNDEYEATVQLPSAEFQRICRDLSSIGDEVNISVAKDGISFSAAGELSKGSVHLKQSVVIDNEDDSIVINMENPVSLDFAMKHLSMFAKSAILSKKVTLCLSNESPMMVEFQIEDLGYLRYYLAPKIDDAQ